jgi:ribosomal protein S18 acetylase RimI-like enzyme
MTITLRPARREDAGALARLIDLAAEGLPGHLWAGMAEPGEDPLAVGTRRAARDEGTFSWRNAVVAECEGQVAGGIVAWPMPEAPQPLDGLPPVLRPVQALENRVGGTLYVNSLAVFPGFQRRGIGRRLLVGTFAADRPVSLIRASANTSAATFYHALGFVEIARAALVRDGWHSDSAEWVLMLRPALAKRAESV